MFTHTKMFKLVHKWSMGYSIEGLSEIKVYHVNSFSVIKGLGPIEKTIQGEG